jgi:hypothetical protein
MRKEIKALFVGLTIYAILALIQTRIDFYFNSELYTKGLIFSEMWYIPYSQLYFFLSLFYVFVAFLFAFIVDRNLSVKLLTVLFFFSYSSGCDFIYFGIWEKGVFPSNNWLWMWQYNIFGIWLTIHQIIFTISLTLLGLFCAFIIGKIIKKVNQVWLKCET